LEVELTGVEASDHEPAIDGSGRKPLVYAHRLGGGYGPESSRAALERTLVGAAAGVEADVVLTADEEIVLCHDPLLSLSTADLSGWADEHTSEELTRARLLGEDGEPSDQTVMNLRELLDSTSGDLQLQLDVKAYADPVRAHRAAERCCVIVEEFGCRDRVEIVSFFTAACAVATRVGFKARLAVWADYDPRALARWTLDHGAGGLSMEGFILGQQLHDAIRDGGLTLSIGAVNEAEQLRRILPFEPEIIVSDRPNEMSAVIDELALACPE
jgi:glycerophosphoryl diester phosphodiesterase